MTRRALYLTVALLIAVGCGRPEDLSVQELAARLREQGLRYEVAETAALPRIRGEGLRLRGEGLDVEIHRIENEEHLKLAAAAAGLAAAGSKAGPGPGLAPLVSPPFLFVVRAEPQPGQVAAAAAAVFGD